MGRPTSRNVTRFQASIIAAPSDIERSSESSGRNATPAPRPPPTPSATASERAEQPSTTIIEDAEEARASRVARLRGRRAHRSSQGAESPSNSSSSFEDMSPSATETSKGGNDEGSSKTKKNPLKSSTSSGASSKAALTHRKPMDTGLAQPIAVQHRQSEQSPRGSNRVRYTNKMRQAQSGTDTEEGFTTDDDDDYFRSSVPGAMRVNGEGEAQVQMPMEEDSINDDSAAAQAPTRTEQPEISPLGQSNVPTANANDPGFMATAFAVDDVEAADNLPQAEIMEKPFWTRRKLLIVGSLLIIIIVAVSLTGAIGNPKRNSQSPPTESPTFAPTEAPSDRPREWIVMHDEPLGMDNIAVTIVGNNPGNDNAALKNDDDHGQAVAMSTDGLVIASSAPGRYVAPRIYRSGSWQDLPILNVTSFYYDLDYDDVLGATADGNGSSNNTMFGHSLSLSRDGEWLAVGVPGANTGTGEVLLFRMNGNQTGYDRVGPPLLDASSVDIGGFGWSLSLSDNGSRLAVGTTSDLKGRCFADVYSYDQVNMVWSQVGPGVACGTLQPVEANTTFLSISGTAVRMSNDGNILAVGAVNLNADLNNPTDPGTVTIYEFDGRAWLQLGQILVKPNIRDSEGGGSGSSGRPGSSGPAPGTVTGPSPDDDPERTFGHSIDLANNGHTIAIGLPSNLGLRDTGDGASSNSTVKRLEVGVVMVYDFDPNTFVWSRRGLVTPSGINEGDLFGESVVLSSRGDVLAIGAPGSGLDGPSAGYAEMYEYDSSTERWKIIGSRIRGFSLTASTGTAIAMSGNGRYVAVGSPFSNDGLLSGRRGIVQVYATGARLGSNGDIQLKIESLYSVPGNYALRWRIERLDAPSQLDGETYVASYTRSLNQGVAIDETTELITAESNGVYRLSIIEGSDKDDNGVPPPGNLTVFETEIFENSVSSEDEVVIATGPLGSFNEVTFATSPIGVLGQELMSDEVLNEDATLLLVFDFDDKPEEVHWIVRATWRYQEEGTGRPRQARKIVAFGPTHQYSTDLKGRQLSETIDISKVPADASFTLTVVDVGRDGLCCSHGEGSYRLYFGPDAVASNLLLNSLENSSESGDGDSFGRRATIGFVLPEDVSADGA